MTTHPLIFQLSKRVGRFLPIPGIVAGAAYLLTLSHGVYPGCSATLTAAAAGLIPPSQADHPLFAWVARHVAACDVFSLPVRLNLFSALCGTLCAMLLYHLVSRMILFSACEDVGSGEWDDLLDEHVDNPDVVSVMPFEVELYNRRVPQIAIAGGLIAAFLCTFMVPTWSAATRLDNGLFDLFLALASLSLFLTVHPAWRLSGFALSIFLFVLGLFDSAVFLLLLPFYAFFTFRAFWFSPQRSATGCWIMVAGLAGSAISICAYLHNVDGPATTTLLQNLLACARALPAHHYRELYSFLPRAGWLLVLLQTGLPAMTLLFWQQALFKDKRGSTLTALLLVTLAVAPGLLNLSIAPVFFFGSSPEFMGKQR
ncbi:MAG: hypothetical protein WCK89_11965 [bacterium]